MNTTRVATFRGIGSIRRIEEEEVSKSHVI